jgi:hypothetical protein
MGKKEVYVLTLRPGEVHEEDAARRMARAIAGRNLKLTAPREGKVDFIAKIFGLLKVKVATLEKINRIGAVILSTRHNHSIVRAGDVVADTRIIPLLPSKAGGGIRGVAVHGCPQKGFPPRPHGRSLEPCCGVFDVL